MKETTMLTILLLISSLHTGLGAICRIYADPYLRPFDHTEEFALNDDILPEGKYPLIKRTSNHRADGPSFSVDVLIGHPYYMGSVGCGWSPNVVTLNISDFEIAFEASKDGSALLFTDEPEPEILNLPYSTTVGSTEIDMVRHQNSVFITAYLPWRLSISISKTDWRGRSWGRITVVVPNNIDRSGWVGICTVEPSVRPPTVCGGQPVINSRLKRYSSGSLKSPKRKDIRSLRENNRQSDCSRLRGTKKWACQNRSRNTRSLDQLSTVYTYPSGTNVTETVAIHTRTRRYVHAINVDQSVISRVCNKVKDASGPFAVCVNSGDFNAANQFLVCEAMLNGMGTDKPTTCVVLSQIAANCQDVVDGLSDSVWRSAVGC